MNFVCQSHSFLYFLTRYNTLQFTEIVDFKYCEGLKTQVRLPENKDVVQGGCTVLAYKRRMHLTNDLSTCRVFTNAFVMTYVYLKDLLEGSHANLHQAIGCSGVPNYHRGQNL